MLFVGGNEEHVPGVELGALLAGDKVPATTHHHINLVPSVRLLRIFPARRVELNAQRAVLEQFGEALAFWSGKLGEAIGNGQRVKSRIRHGDWTRQKAGLSPAVAPLLRRRRERGPALGARSAIRTVHD